VDDKLKTNYLSH